MVTIILHSNLLQLIHEFLFGKKKLYIQKIVPHNNNGHTLGFNLVNIRKSLKVTKMEERLRRRETM